MNVFSRNCGMYCRIPRRSVSFKFAPGRSSRGLQVNFANLETLPLYNETPLPRLHNRIHQPLRQELN
jgi:hypothetical protein